MIWLSLGLVGLAVLFVFVVALCAAAARGDNPHGRRR